MFTDTFLLNSEKAREFYAHVKDLPIVDYHNHLDPKEIYENKPFKNIASLWLDHDHYKWRLMRHSGIDEKRITGTASYIEKFDAFVQSIEKAYMNPLYHWSHMELNKYFGITDIMKASHSDALYNTINEKLSASDIGPRELLLASNVEVVCTTDSVEDSLTYHKLLQEEAFEVKVLPTFRPDKLMQISKQQFVDTLNVLTELESLSVRSVADLESLLKKRLNHFAQHGCVISDHGLSTLYYFEVSEEEANSILVNRLNHKTITELDEEKFKVYLLKFFMTEYAKRGWTTQLHIGAIRNTNDRLYEQLGTDAGCDSISDHNYVDDLNRLLNELNNNTLPRIIIYNLNPRDNEAIASLCGNFSGNVQGKIQLGAPWWFNDHYQGIVNHLEVYATYLNIDTFTGMLTDSRSFSSFVRHDYFRRILCNHLAKKVNNGFIPDDALVIEVIKNISYYNSKKYLGL